MEYSVYKLEFKTAVHFGEGTLNDSAQTFPADLLFSALYMEAIKMNCADSFYETVQKGDLLFSDAFPYVGDTYLLPKPMVYIERRSGNNLEQDDKQAKEAKKFKKMKFIPVEKLEEYLTGRMTPDQNDMEDFGAAQQQVMAAVRSEREDTLPFHVGRFSYLKGNGLYLIIAYREEESLYLLEDLLDSLSCTGIGGKKSSGLGKFVLKTGAHTEFLQQRLKKEASRWMLLSTALPRDEELDEAMEGASYLLQKRSGFVASEQYAKTWQKKKDLYVFSAGSCFKNRFEGDIYDVSDGGNHPVYRYAKPLFMGV